MGIRDVGFGITVSARNVKDMSELYRLAESMGIEFAPATVHHSYYFHKDDNGVSNQKMVAGEFVKIAEELLRTNKPKNWFRAYFNMGLARKVRGQKRALPCEVGTDMFFVDPFSNVLPCNGSDEPMIMGNLSQQTFTEIWRSAQAEKIRKLVENCPKQCWMIGSAAPAMKKRIGIPLKWVIKNKLKIFYDKENQNLSPI
jgi:MoaA/NifB/PqqE/SkfB family radical SAM enzyme